mmetsp:Transcript_19792/g.36474  ORF Transcript_19792/g.36474 Transcript_19792/m.36474 type:complete len:1210 (+) Transcript_19792:2977-6606(+)
MNNYHVFEVIGRGKHSVVYKGRKKKSLQYVAIKSADKTRRKKIMQELKIYHCLEHPHVLKFHCWYETRNHLWVITEYCTGGNLLELIEQDKSLPEEVVLDFGADLVRGLIYLHSNGVIFGDLKPSNVLLNEFGSLKLSDFGLARKLVDMVQFEADNKRGTPCYMAPELFQESGVHSIYSDIWSLGCVLYEMANGSPPFTSSNMKELVSVILNKPLDPLPKYSQEFNQLIRDMLEKDPAQRISWDELMQLPLWKGKLRGLEVDLPVQPLYEKYLSSRGVTQRSAGVLSTSQTNVLRISQAVQQNISREQGKEASIKDRNRVIDFGGPQEEDEENEGSIELSIYEEDHLPTQQFKPPSGEVLKNTQLASIKSRTKSIMDGEAEEERVVTNHGRSNSEHTIYTTPTSKSVTKIPLEQLFIHTLDISVGSIKESEKFHPPTFDRVSLPFQPQTFDDEAELSSIQVHMSDIFTALKRSSDKENLLNYFESLIVNATTANAMFSGVVVNYLIGLLMNSSVSNTALKARICSIFGTMCRHATVIEDDVAQTGIIKILADQLMNSEASVRRNAMSALGEIMFYSATKMEDSDPLWTIDAELVKKVIACAVPSEDSLVQLFAVKTIENITAQSKACGTMFACKEVVSYLIQYLDQPKLRLTAGISLSHIIRINSEIVPFFIQKITPPTFCMILSDGDSRLQQAFMTILIFILQYCPKIVYSLNDHTSFLPTLVRMLEHDTIIVRGKALLAFLLLFKMNARWIIAASDLKFFSIIDKFKSEKFKYVQACLHHLLELMLEISNLIVKNVQEEVSRSSEVTKSLCPLLPIVLHMTCAQSTKGKVATSNFIRNLASIVIYFHKLKPEYGECLIKVLENLSIYQKALATHSEAVVTALLPALLSQVQCSDVRSRFSFWKIFTDISIICLMDEEVFDIRCQTKVSSKGLTDILLKQLPPLLRNLLSDNDTISLCTLRLLAIMVERCPPIVSTLKRTSLVGDLFSNFEANSGKLNSYLIGIIKTIVISREFTLDELNEFNLPQKLNAILKLVEANQQDWCLELLLDIAYEILFETNNCLRLQKNISDSSINENTAESALTYAQPVLENFSFFCKLLSATATLSEKATHCIALLLQLFSYQFCQQPAEYLTPAMLQELQSLLLCNKPSLQKRTLKFFELALKSSESSVSLSFESKARLSGIFESLCLSEDSTIAATATELKKVLRA